jgi:Flp pilus assembly protein TadD
VRALLEALPHPRFDVCKAISDLVLRGVARPCKADEIEALIQTALAEDDAEAAVELMTRALGLERNNRALRRQLAELLERLGRNADAAAELAQRGSTPTI